MELTPIGAADTNSTSAATPKASVPTAIIRANSQNSQGPTNPNASQAADANGAGFSLPQSKQILPYSDTRTLDTSTPQQYDAETLASIPKAETIDGKSPLENENVKEMLGEVERGEAGSISVDVPIEIAQAITGKGVGYNKDIQRNIEAATSGNTVTHEWFMKNVLEPLENAKAAISEAMYDILPKYKADMERLGIKKGSKESAAVMYYGEGVTADGNPYTLDNLKQDFPSTWKNIVEADRINRRMYDDYVDKINRIAWIVLHFCAEAVRPSGVIPVQDECGFSSTHSIYRL